MHPRINVSNAFGCLASSTAFFSSTAPHGMPLPLPVTQSNNAFVSALITFRRLQQACVSNAFRSVNNYSERFM